MSPQIAFLQDKEFGAVPNLRIRQPRAVFYAMFTIGDCVDSVFSVFRPVLMFHVRKGVLWFPASCGVAVLTVVKEWCNS